MHKYLNSNNVEATTHNTNASHCFMLINKVSCRVEHYINVPFETNSHYSNIDKGGEASRFVINSPIHVHYDILIRIYMLHTYTWTYNSMQIRFTCWTREWGPVSFTHVCAYMTEQHDDSNYGIMFRGENKHSKRSPFSHSHSLSLLSVNAAHFYRSKLCADQTGI